jgi:hypothetical protein
VECDGPISDADGVRDRVDEESAAEEVATKEYQRMVFPPLPQFSGKEVLAGQAPTNGISPITSMKATHTRTSQSQLLKRFRDQGGKTFSILHCGQS